MDTVPDMSTRTELEQCAVESLLNLSRPSIGDCRSAASSHSQLVNEPGESASEHSDRPQYQQMNRFPEDSTLREWFTTFMNNAGQSFAERINSAENATVIESETTSLSPQQESREASESCAQCPHDNQRVQTVEVGLGHSSGVCPVSESPERPVETHWSAFIKLIQAVRDHYSNEHNDLLQAYSELQECRKVCEMHGQACHDLKLRVDAIRNEFNRLVVKKSTSPEPTETLTPEHLQLKDENWRLTKQNQILRYELCKQDNAIRGLGKALQQKKAVEGCQLYGDLVDKGLGPDSPVVCTSDSDTGVHVTSSPAEDMEVDFGDTDAAWILWRLGLDHSFDVKYLFDEGSTCKTCLETPAMQIMLRDLKNYPALRSLVSGS